MSENIIETNGGAVLKTIPVRALAKEYQRDLVYLAGAKLLEGLMVLLAAWGLSRIVSGLFLAHMSPSEAAPHFAVLLFSMLLKNLVMLREKNLCSRLSEDTRRNLRKKIHEAILERSAADSAGSLQAIALDCVDVLDDFFRQVLPLLLSAAVLLPLYLLVMIPLDPPTALLFLLTLPIAPLLLYLIGRVTRSANEKQWQNLTTLQGEFSELLQGLFTLKIFRREAAQERFLESICHAFSTASLKVLQLAFVSSFALELITTLSIALIAVSIGLRLLAGYMEFDCAFYALLLAPEFYHPLRQGGTAFHTLMNCRAAWDKIATFLEGSCPAPDSRRKDKIRHPPSLHVNGLSFAYPGQKHPILQNLSFSLPAGSLTVLSGTSGSGKSTLLRLLAGIFPPSQGSISLDEFPLRKIAPEDRPNHIAYVPQEPHVFMASLRDNVGMFQPFDDVLIQKALRRAGLGKWLQALPEGLDTPLGNGGMALSNGQRHRLGLARAILQDAPVVLLDEVTAGLDETAEQEILAFLKDFSHRRTILFASHRPAVLEAFPNTLHLDAGKEDICP